MQDLQKKIGMHFWSAIDTEPSTSNNAFFPLKTAQFKNTFEQSLPNSALEVYLVKAVKFDFNLPVQIILSVLKKHRPQLLWMYYYTNC